MLLMAVMLSVHTVSCISTLVVRTSTRWLEHKFKLFGVNSMTHSMSDLAKNEIDSHLSVRNIATTVIQWCGGRMQGLLVHTACVLSSHNNDVRRKCNTLSTSSLIIPMNGI